MVVKDGERFKVVRQHRRMKMKKPASEHAPSDRWLPMAEVLAALGLAERKQSVSRPQKCKFCDEPATKALIWADGRAYVPVCGDDHLAKAREKVGEKGVGVRPIPVS